MTVEEHPVSAHMLPLYSPRALHHSKLLLTFEVAQLLHFSSHAPTDLANTSEEAPDCMPISGMVGVEGDS